MAAFDSPKWDLRSLAVELTRCSAAHQPCLTGLPHHDAWCPQQVPNVLVDIEPTRSTSRTVVDHPQSVHPITGQILHVGGIPVVANRAGVASLNFACHSERPR